MLTEPPGFSHGEHQDLIHDVKTVHIEDVTKAKEKVFELAKHFDKEPIELDIESYFAISLCDGVHGTEDSVLSTIGFLTDIMVAGGTASDKLTFDNTFIHFNGTVFKKGCILSLVKAKKNFVIKKTQSFKTTERTASITKFGNSPREVLEINNKNAVEEYARLFNIDIDKINGSSTVFALAMEQNGEMYARDVHCTDGTKLLFACDMIENYNYNIAYSTDILSKTQSVLNEAKKELGREPEAIIHFQCALRFLNLCDNDKEIEYINLFKNNNMLGLTCYGEQCIGHMNNTGVFILL